MCSGRMGESPSPYMSPCCRKWATEQAKYQEEQQSLVSDDLDALEFTQVCVTVDAIQLGSICGVLSGVVVIAWSAARQAAPLPTCRMMTPFTLAPASHLSPLPARRPAALE